MNQKQHDALQQQGLLQQFTGQLGGAYRAISYPNDRELIIQKMKDNEIMIRRLTQDNKELQEALDILDEHPKIEKLMNTIRRFR